MKTIAKNIMLVALLCTLSSGCASTSKLSGILWTSKKSDRAARKFADDAVASGIYSHEQIAAAMSKQTPAATVSYDQSDSRRSSSCSKSGHKH